MTVRYNRKRTFRVWELNNTWYGVETKHIVNGILTVPYKACFSGKTKDEVVDQIHTRCRFEELVDNGMDRAKAASVALFGE